MSPVPIAAAVVVFVMPLVASADAWRHSASSWARVERRRWFWGVVPACVTLISLPVESFVPSLVALAIAAVYSSKVRPLLSVADGVDSPRRETSTNLTPRERAELGEMLLAGGGVAVFMGFVVYIANGARELLIGIAMAFAMAIAIVARVVFIIRRTKSR